MNNQIYAFYIFLEKLYFYKEPCQHEKKWAKIKNFLTEFKDIPQRNKQDRRKRRTESKRETKVVQKDDLRKFANYIYKNEMELLASKKYKDRLHMYLEIICRS